jgi:hypothetical protein
MPQTHAAVFYVTFSCDKFYYKLLIAHVYRYVQQIFYDMQVLKLLCQMQTSKI